ncbi:MAG: TetR/AcrR family transcriptional regulator [Oscillospiraceae bacterium]|nr:TetR/AcrR family transcriptional regulator [Oscillospiraceae bacterium]
MAKGTKERILEAALDMFSQYGFAGTNIRELAGSLGMGKSSMYRHFESKEEIWNALLDELIAYYEARFGSPEHLPPVPDSPEELVTMTMRMVNLTARDEKIVKTRKLLSIEQFRDDRARALATKHFLTGLTEMFARLFAGMMDKGLLRRDDPAMLAFAYTAPISALIHLCDREPKKTEDAMARVEAFSRHFIKIYGGKSNEQ